MKIPSELLDLLLALLPDLRFLPTPWQARVSSPYRHSFGLIVQPGPRGWWQYVRILTTNPVEFFANYMGHTALYVRVDGRIERVIGFDPHRFAMWADPIWTGLPVMAGTGATAGYVYSEEAMFRSPDAMMIEFRLSREEARRLLRRLPQIGMAQPGQLPHLYVTRGGAQLQRPLAPGVWGNCIDCARVFLEGQGRSLWLRNQPLGSSQGELIKRFQELRLELRPGRVPPFRSKVLRPRREVQALARTGNLVRSFGAFRVIFPLGVGLGRLVVEHTGVLWFDLSGALGPAYDAANAIVPLLAGTLGPLGSLATPLAPLLEWVASNTDLSLLDPFAAPLLADYLLFAGLIWDFLLATVRPDYRRGRSALTILHTVTATAAWLMAVVKLVYGWDTAVMTVLPLLMTYLAFFVTG